MSPEASQIALHSDVMSQAVVYLPTPKAGASFTRTGIRLESERTTSYPPYISVSLSPIECMRSFTRYAPELVEPPSQTSSAFAAASSEGMIICCRRPSTYEPGGGMRAERERTVV